MSSPRWFLSSLLGLCSCLLLPVTAAHADAMSCGRKLVSDGSSMYDVQSRCGVPDAAQHRVEYRTVRAWVSTPCAPGAGPRCGFQAERTVEVAVDEWIHDFGPHQFVRTVVFEQGVLIAIKTGSYGNKIR